MNESVDPALRSSAINIAHLHTFRHVMQQGGYAAAARVTDLSVPSIWQHIHALEKLYDVELFHRVGRQVRPTAAANQLYEEVDSILVQLESTFERMSSEPSKQTIRLVTGVRMMIEDLAEPLAMFHEQHLNRLAIRQGNERRALEMLLADEADLALTLEPGLHQGSSGIHYEPAYTVEFLAVCSKSHPYAKSRSNGLRELSKHPLVVTAAGTHGRDALEQAFHREGLVANIHIETDNSAFTIACVASGFGVGILAGRQQGDMCRSLATRSLSKQLGKRKIVFMWRKGRLLTEPMLQLIEAIKQIETSGQLA
ncbi:LysR family transcriptional regulator [Aporhodopirellula aestuarii]|uniref:LysR family transcriptional regulator n=1 Tax=Aporhodopirellula aestuarii TaxID=2950107 RepID=A0ABT0U1C7_9BACT|nr:LysR family transcriptional regulator [Aporhodopirellula aestuarii]MCM2370581.1 LysR family transcriptional regulator [Aporhodopirellula aestuarii]